MNWKVPLILKEIGPANVGAYKEVRLRALQDAPSAFGSTYATESLLSDADWLRRAVTWSNDRSKAYLAMHGGEGCGLAGGYIDEHDPRNAHLVSMWVAPAHRRSGIGAALVQAVCTWAGLHGVFTVQLMVTSSNLHAIDFYRRMGFAMTGHAEPYPNDSDLVEYGMARSLGQS